MTVFNFRIHVDIYHANCDKLIVAQSYFQHEKSTEWSKLLKSKFPTLLSTFKCYLDNSPKIIGCFLLFFLPLPV